MIRIGGVGRVSSQIGTSSRIKKLNSEILAAVAQMASAKVVPGSAPSLPPPPPPAPAVLARADWYVDPTGRHAHRYWNGSGWTANVADAGVAGLDPVVEPLLPPTISSGPPPPNN